DRVQGDVAGARYGGRLAGDAVAALREHRFGEIDEPIARRLGANVTAAVRRCLSREDAGEAILESTILAEHEADLTTAHADVAGGNVGAFADVSRQLVHQCLAETHHLALALALGIEVRTALAAPHRKARERVLERLLEAQEFENAQRDGR